VTGDLFRPDWVFDHLDDLWLAIGEHFWLTFLAVTIGFAISFPVGIYTFRHHRAYTPVTIVAGLLYTIPSLALFAALQPFTGLSTTTAQIGLVSYTLLILIRNIVAGLDGVSDDVKEAAVGMGYTERQLLWRVEIPLALPTIVAGLRIATVTTIGLVTVTALIGKGGLGYFILLGLSRTFTTAIILGAGMSVVLAVVVDFVLLRAERFLVPWARTRVGAAT
jgi:osmoprotectant transport system permease protein